MTEFLIQLVCVYHTDTACQTMFRQCCEVEINALKIQRGQRKEISPQTLDSPIHLDPLQITNSMRKDCDCLVHCHTPGT